MSNFSKRKKRKTVIQRNLGSWQEAEAAAYASQWESLLFPFAAATNMGGWPPLAGLSGPPERFPGLTWEDAMLLEDPPDLKREFCLSIFNGSEVRDPVHWIWAENPCNAAV